MMEQSGGCDREGTEESRGSRTRRRVGRGGIRMTKDMARNVADLIERTFFDVVRQDDTIDNFL